jgi:hypothetical protein
MTESLILNDPELGVIDMSDEDDTELNEKIDSANPEQAKK